MLVNEPTDSDLRRAASTAYYSLFHELSLYFGTIALHPDSRSFTRPHLQAYRYLDHGLAKAR